MKKIIPLIIIGAVIALIGLFSSSNTIENISGYFLFSEDSIEINSPHDRIKEEQIKVYESLIILNVNNSELVSLENTNSMDPLIDEESNIIQIKPESEEDIHIGDLVSYEDIFTKKVILHRVVDIRADSLGKFFILKGDNVNSTDLIKVRFEQIKGIVVAIVY